MNYYRAAGNVESLLKLDNATHFQSIAMITRSLFELAVDLYLIDKIAGAPLKMLFFVEVEKLRSARKIIEFEKLHPDRGIDISAQSAFVTNNAQRIQQNWRTLWPSKKKAGGEAKIKHWSGKDLGERVKLLGDPFDEMYNGQYARLSWYVHSGLTGVANLPAEFFANLCGFALGLSIACYSKILEGLIREMKINLADEKISATLKYAALLPFTKSPEEEALLFRGLLG